MYINKLMKPISMEHAFRYLSWALVKVGHHFSRRTALLNTFGYYNNYFHLPFPKSNVSP